MLSIEEVQIWTPGEHPMTPEQLIDFPADQLPLLEIEFALIQKRYPNFHNALMHAIHEQELCGYKTIGKKKFPRLWELRSMAYVIITACSISSGIEFSCEVALQLGLGEQDHTPLEELIKDVPAEGSLRHPNMRYLYEQLEMINKNCPKPLKEGMIPPSRPIEAIVNTICQDLRMLFIHIKRQSKAEINVTLDHLIEEIEELETR